jgi:hypothetical protein
MVKKKTGNEPLRHLRRLRPCATGAGRTAVAGGGLCVRGGLPPPPPPPARGAGAADRDRGGGSGLAAGAGASLRLAAPQV